MGRTNQKSRAGWWLVCTLAGVLAVTFAGLAAAVAAAPAEPAGPAAEPGGDDSAATDGAGSGSGTVDPRAARPPARSSFTRLPPRPESSDEEYDRQADSLRAAYAKPPAEWPAPRLDEGVAHRELGPLPPPEFPKDNPYSKEKADLGLHLFFDPRLSGSGQIACASCHDPDLGWADGRTVSFGHGRSPTKRNAPSVFMAAYGKSFFWDGRAASLEAQVLGPITSDGEMRGDPKEIEARLAKVPGYREWAAAAFGSEEVTMDRVAAALATFQRSVARIGGKSLFDRFLAGEADVLPDAAVRGLHLFRTDGRCMNCHNGPLLTDEQYHDVGLSYYGRALEDLGRYQVTRDAKDVGKFKTPTLRNVARTGPYMHNGLFQLEGVLNMYNAGMPTLRPKKGQVDDRRFPTKSPLLHPLGLNRQDLSDLKAFLESLTDRRVRLRPKVLPADGEPQPGAARDPAKGR